MSPRLVMPPRRLLPPLECCLGVRPIQAPNCAPFLNCLKAAASLMGIGPVGASAVVATVGDFKQFKNGAQFGAWIVSGSA